MKKYVLIGKINQRYLLKFSDLTFRGIPIFTDVKQKALTFIDLKLAEFYASKFNLEIKEL